MLSSDLLSMHEEHRKTSPFDIRGMFTRSTPDKKSILVYVRSLYTAHARCKHTHSLELFKPFCLNYFVFITTANMINLNILGTPLNSNSD